MKVASPTIRALAKYTGTGLLRQLASVGPPFRIFVGSAVVSAKAVLTWCMVLGPDCSCCR